MKRKLYNDLLDWKKSINRKPLLLQGARQVGKTYLVKVFGETEYRNFFIFNFEQDPLLKTIFKGNLDPQKIINDLGLYIGAKINIKDTLIFFDEIQAAPEALTSLKYFQENAPDYHIIAAGSLLGVSIEKQQSFPVGKVNFMKLYPLTFIEYLKAFDEDLLVDQIFNDENLIEIPEFLHHKLLSHFKSFLYLGGMPEVLQSYRVEKDIALARKIQLEILDAYRRDFSKYTDKAQAIKTSELWNSIPFQLAKENKKFKYSDVRKNARVSMFEQTIEWLKSAGLINLAYNIETPKIPLSGYTDYSKFKIYLLDSGLLGAMLKISSEIILKPNELFSEYNGAFIENFIASELVCLNEDQLYYWTSKSAAEVDFIIQQQNEIFPLEVKSGTNRNLKSLQSYSLKYSPRLIFRASPRNFLKSDKFINIPLYGISMIKKLM